MADLLKQIEQEHLKKNIPDFRPGDTVRVGVTITEGSGDDQRSRVQPYEGVVIARSGSGLNETFTVRRVTHGVGVERTFPVHSPVVASIEVIRKGNPRRAKLYYLRDRVGRRARVREDVTGKREQQDDAEQAGQQIQDVAQEPEAAPQETEDVPQAPQGDETADAEQ